MDVGRLGLESVVDVDGFRVNFFFKTLKKDFKCIHLFVYIFFVQKAN